MSLHVCYSVHLYCCVCVFVLVCAYYYAYRVRSCARFNCAFSYVRVCCGVQAAAPHWTAVLRDTGRYTVLILQLPWTGAVLPARGLLLLRVTEREGGGPGPGV